MAKDAESQVIDWLANDVEQVVDSSVRRALEERDRVAAAQAKTPDEREGETLLRASREAQGPHASRKFSIPFMG